MNSLFAFQTKYTKQNLVLKIIVAKRYALISNSPQPSDNSFKKTNMVLIEIKIIHYKKSIEND